MSNNLTPQIERLTKMNLDGIINGKGSTLVAFHWELFAMRDLFNLLSEEYEALVAEIIQLRKDNESYKAKIRKLILVAQIKEHGFETGEEE